MKLSIVTTLYYSAPFVAELHCRASAAAREAVGDDYEILFVNDGSPDDSLERAVRLCEHDPRCVVVDLSRNFGHHRAMMTGLAHARGELVFLLDSDLEEQPEWLGTFLTQLHEEAADVVYGVQRRRKGGWVERCFGSLFYRLIRASSGLDMPQDMVTARLMTARYVAALLLHQERETDIGGLWAITGFRQRPQAVVKLSKPGTSYSLGHKLRLATTSLVSFSTLPLSLIFSLGLLITVPALLCLLSLPFVGLIADRPAGRWEWLLASMWLLGGMTITSVGVIGLYLSRMMVEVKRRPYTIIRDIYGRDQS